MIMIMEADKFWDVPVRWYSSNLKARLKTQEESVFQFRSKGRGKNYVPVKKAARQEAFSPTC